MMRGSDDAYGSVSVCMYNDDYVKCEERAAERYT